jgi:7-keto-8-aminopelargonate synthetase-like enzyme
MIAYIDSFPGREINIDHKTYRYFGGTSYLGIQNNTAFQDLYIKNIKKYGTNYGASRKSNLRFSLFEKAEAYLATLAGSEACLTLSSGYLAGQFVCAHLGSDPKALFYVPNTHSALYQSLAVPYPTFTELNKVVRAFLASHPASTPIVLLDSINFSGSNYPDFQGIKSLPLKDIILVVDDSHGIGILGENGGGLYRKLLSLGAKELIVCCALGKSFGVQAGAVFSSKKRIEAMMDTDFFGGASPTAPANLATLMEAEDLYEEKRRVLQENISLFRKNAALERFSCMENHPAFSFSNAALTAYLKDHGVIVTHFNYPSTDASLMSRIVISAAHTGEDIFYLTKLLSSYS